jgi:uncharacterized membrane protein (DUF106 family)
MRRHLDQLASTVIMVTTVAMIIVWVTNYVSDRELMAVTSAQSQEAINATQKERDASFDKRLEHLEKMQDAIFVSLLGVFVAMIVNIKNQKQRQQHHHA